MRAVADSQLLRDVDARLRKHFYLVDQSRRIHNHAVSDDGLDAGTQNPARNQLQNEFFLTDENRVTGIVAPLVARHDRKLLGE